MNDKSPLFRLITYQQRKDVTDPIRAGLAIGEKIVALEALAEHHPLAQDLANVATASAFTPGVQGLLTNWEKNFDALCEVAAFVTREGLENGPWSREVTSPEAVHVLAPVPRPSKMLYEGANYERHVQEAENWKESGLKDFKGIDKSVARPYAFVKLPSCIIGPYDPVVYPRAYQKLDWEVELGLVIGKRGKYIPVEHAMDHVAGFLTVNDMSLRDLNMRPDWPYLASDWLAGKNFDTSAPLGPYLVPRQFVPEYQNLRLMLKVNGQMKQDFSTQHMVFKPDEIIAFLSTFVTLEPGDVIATGTTPGTGFATGRYLNVGDVVEAEVEGLGRQRNVVIAEER